MARVGLSGKPILITGASSGIGRATALLCAGAGMPVAALARRSDRLRSLVDEIESLGGEGVALEADVSDAGACAAAVESAERSLGPLYAVFANAGYGMERPVHLMSDDELRRMFEVNLFGTLHTIRPALPGMLERGSGHVLINSSSIGKVAVPGFGAYCATKGAQWLLGRAMNLELRGRGVRTSTVHPVGTRTEFYEAARVAGGQAEPLAEHTPRLLQQSAGTVARAVVGCLRRPRSEVWPTWTALIRVGIAIGNAFPALADWGTKGYVPADRGG